MRPQRREFVKARVDLDGSAILEVGAMDSPTFPELDVRYLDWFSRDELQAMIAGNPNRIPERVVEPDYIVKDKEIGRSVSDSFDVVIANHVLEHIADPIYWLQQIAALTNSGGGLCLAVPDRRYTFDYLRPVSTAVDLLRAHVEDLQQPSRWQMLESTFHYRPVRAADVWGGDVERKLAAGRGTLDAAYAKSTKAEREYVDVHCHVFTCETFPALIDDLASAGYIAWRMADIRDVERDGNEFLVHLTRG